MLVLAISGVLMSMTTGVWDPWLERQHLSQQIRMVRDALAHAQLLALTRLSSHQVREDNQQIIIQALGTSDNTRQVWESLPEDIRIQATRWPSFSPSGFAAGGTLTLQSANYEVQIVVSPIGKIRQTEILPQ
ncbi:MAG: hypothetical protein HQM11_04955 [SAR324 cluster bacterium]|nr:hypothetical protein [SAR324 cluster bacterium]